VAAERYYLFYSMDEVETKLRHAAVDAAVLQYRMRRVLERPHGEGPARNQEADGRLTWCQRRRLTIDGVLPSGGRPSAAVLASSFGIEPTDPLQPTTAASNQATRTKNIAS